MDCAGLWKLFWATGHPGVWLAIRRLTEDREKRAIPALGQTTPREL